MNHKLVDLWVRAHVAKKYNELVQVDNAYHYPSTVIDTLQFVYNAFGLPKPLDCPTEEEIREYRKTGHLSDCG